MRFLFFKYLHLFFRRLIYTLPFPLEKKLFIIKKFAKVSPIKNVVYNQKIPNPIRFKEIRLFYRKFDKGDLGIVNCFLRGEHYEREVVKALYKYLEKGGIFIDGGAHIGYHTIIAAKIVGDRGKVIAFEPYEESFNILKKNIFLNKVEKIVIAEKKALWKEDGVLFLEVPDGISTSVKLNTKSNNKKRISVESVSLDSYLKKNKISKVDLIKLDLEGSEPYAFEGMREVISNNKEIKIICEFNINNLKLLNLSVSDFFEPLLKCGIIKWYILLERREFPLTIPKDIEKLVKLAMNKNLNLLGTS